MVVVVDSSVFVASLTEDEPFSAESLNLIRNIQAQKISVIIPTTVVFEVVAAVARRSGDTPLAYKVGTELLSMPAVSVIDLTTFRVLRGLAFTAEARLTGMDAIVVNTAIEFDLPLITLDKEMAERAKKFVKILPITNL